MKRRQHFAVVIGLGNVPPWVTVLTKEEGDRMELFGFGKKKLKDKFSLAFHKEPATCTPNELAVAMTLSAHLAEVDALSVDPTKVHLILQFKDTGHTMCLNLVRGGDGRPTLEACKN
jgi:hypothetical protein